MSEFLDSRVFSVLTTQRFQHNSVGTLTLRVSSQQRFPLTSGNPIGLVYANKQADYVWEDEKSYKHTQSLPIFNIVRCNQKL
jgi:hypothetical protein